MFKLIIDNKKVRVALVVGGMGDIQIATCQLLSSQLIVHRTGQYVSDMMKIVMTYLTNDLVIDKEHEGQHQTNPEHQIGRLQQIFKINCDPHSWYNVTK